MHLLPRTDAAGKKVVAAQAPGSSTEASTHTGPVGRHVAGTGTPTLCSSVDKRQGTNVL